MRSLKLNRHDYANKNWKDAIFENLDALFRALTTFKLEGEVTSLSESSQ